MSWVGEPLGTVSSLRFDVDLLWFNKFVLFLKCSVNPSVRFYRTIGSIVLFLDILIS